MCQEDSFLLFTKVQIGTIPAFWIKMGKERSSMVKVHEHNLPDGEVIQYFAL